MFTRKWLMVGLLCWLGVAAAPVVAEAAGGPGCGPGGWGRHGAYWRVFDDGKIETVSGDVSSVQKVGSVKGAMGGVHLELATSAGKIGVHLGPAWYIDQQDPQIRAKDKVEITGVRAEIDGKSVIVATEVRKGKEVLKLRDAEGHPLWCGWRNR